MRKEIDTVFKSFRFRTELVARWAVFLDALDTSFVYEKEKFNLAGIMFVPDFWVEDWNCWIVISYDEPTDEDKDRCEKIAIQTEKGVLLISRIPQFENYSITYFDGPDDLGNLRVSSGWEFGEGRRCGEEIWMVNIDLMRAFTLNSVPHDRDGKYPLSGDFAINIFCSLEAAQEAESSIVKHLETKN